MNANQPRIYSHPHPIPMRTLLFDIDGTLLVTEGAGADSLAAVMRDEFSLPSPDVSLSFAGRTDRSLIQELLTKNELPVDDEHFTRLRDAYFGMFPNMLRRAGGSRLPGVDDILETCRQSPKVRSCVMTGNCDFTARAKLHHFDLLGFVEDIFGGEHDAHRDDMARRTRNLLAERYGTPATESMVVIGDTPADIRCGKAIDAITVGVCTGNHDREALAEHSPDYVFDDLTDPRITEVLIGS